MSRPRPASPQMTSRSSASGRPRSIASRRRLASLRQHHVGQPPAGQGGGQQRADRHQQGAREPSSLPARSSRPVHGGQRQHGLQADIVGGGARPVEAGGRQLPLDQRHLRLTDQRSLGDEARRSAPAGRELPRLRRRPATTRAVCRTWSSLPFSRRRDRPSWTMAATVTSITTAAHSRAMSSGASDWRGPYS